MWFVEGGEPLIQTVRRRRLTELSQPRLLVASLLGWVGVWVFWLALTHDFHPTFPLAVIVTTSLVTAYAVAAYVNHLVLVPRLLSADHRWRYAVWLAITMALLTEVDPILWTDSGLG